MTVAKLGFRSIDFEVFEIPGFGHRMEKIYELVRPKLIRLGNELAPELSRKLHLELFPHVAKHMRRSVNPPPETWVAFGPSARGYKRYAYLALCISRAGLNVRAVVKPEADSRPAIAQRMRAQSTDLARKFAGTRIARYEKWDFIRHPRPAPAVPELFGALADALGKKIGSIDLGFGWTVSEALRLERDEMVEAFRELEPLYRVLMPQLGHADLTMQRSAGGSQPQ